MGEEKNKNEVVLHQQHHHQGNDVEGHHGAFATTTLSSRRCDIDVILIDIDKSPLPMAEHTIATS